MAAAGTLGADGWASLHRHPPSPLPLILRHLEDVGDYRLPLTPPLPPPHILARSHIHDVEQVRTWPVRRPLLLPLPLPNGAVTRVVCPLGPPVYAGSSTATQAPSPGRLQGRAALSAPWSPSSCRPSAPWADGPVHDNTTSA